MKALYTLILFLLAGTAFGQSNLPACQGSDASRWSNCFGSWTASNGDKYVGEFKDDKYNGQGTYYFLADNEFKDDKYVGELKDGKPNGQGTYTFANGDKYVGEWKDNQKHGQGTYTFANGEKYVGEWKDGKNNGQGAFTWAVGDKYVGEYKDGKRTGQGTYTFADGGKYVGEFKDGKFNGQGITYSANGIIEESGIYKDNLLVTSQYIDPNSFIRIARNNSAPAVSDSQRLAIEQRERQVAIEAERLAEQKRIFDAEKAQREQEKKASRIVITATATQPDANGEFILSIQTGADTASLKIDGDEQGGSKDGKYVIRRVARVGAQNVYTISARDVYSNTDTKIIAVARQVADSRPVLAILNPLNVKIQQPRDAVAIIIGIEKYKTVPKAEFANLDAKDFYNYAVRGLGIKPENIKLLLDEEADEIEIVKAFENWLPLQVKKDKTDVYVFYSGHGLPSTDGQSLYFLPYGVDKQYLARTAVGQREVVTALIASKPKSVTMFIDSCYSGQTRGGDVLLASVKPIALKAEANAFPSNFTVITASSNDQVSSSSPELKHGIFSFFLMKGMEGDADSNKDGKITTGEMQEYLSDKVSRQALSMSRKQDIQLIGDVNKILVGR